MNIEIPVAGAASAPAVLTLPAGSTGSGVLVLHAWWGLNSVIKGVCDRLAGEGFVALAPDLYNGIVAATRAEALQTMRKMDKAAARKTLQASTKFLAEHPSVLGARIGVVGFSLGAYYALSLACQKPKNIAAVVLFYGTGGGNFSKSSAAFLGHFAEDDEFEPLGEVGALEDSLHTAGRQAEFHLYPATKHWFFEPDRPEFEPAAAQLAWERTVTFFRGDLSG